MKNKKEIQNLIERIKDLQYCCENLTNVAMHISESLDDLYVCFNNEFNKEEKITPTFESKFGINDNVWVMDSDKPIKLNIKNIIFVGNCVNKKVNMVIYDLRWHLKEMDFLGYNEIDVFESKEKLLNSL